MQRSSLYHEHFGFVWSCLRRFGVAAADLEDATHDAFVVVYRRRAEFARADSPRSWLFGVVRRVASNHRRSAWRTQRRLAAVRDVEPRATRPERDLERADASRVVSRFLEGLPEPQRDVFVLSELHQMTAKEVGALLDINPNTASARLRAARKAFVRFAKDVREQNAWDGEAALARLQHPERPPREARRRVGCALAVTLGPRSTGMVAPGAAVTLRAAAVTLALAGGGLGLIAGAAAVMRPAPREAVPTAKATPGPSTTRSSAKHAPLPAADPPKPAVSGAIASSGPRIERPPPPQATPANTPRRPAPSRSPATKADLAPPASSDAADVLRQQTQLLAKARGALSRGDTREVRRRVEEYRARFEAGPFLADFELLEIRGSCASGDTATAEALGERFVRAHPGSAHLAVIDRTCAGSVTKSGPSGH